MDILQQMSNFAARLSQMEKGFIDIWKAIRKIEGTANDKRANLVSGTYYASVNPTYHEEHQAVTLNIHIHDSRVTIDQVISMEDYSQMFKRNKRDLELFIVVAGFDPLNFAQVHTLKFEVKVAKGVAENQAALIKDVHAVGFWKAGEFIDLNATEGAE